MLTRIDAPYPFGKLADKVRHAALLAWGRLLLIAADALLAVLPVPTK